MALKLTFPSLIIDSIEKNRNRPALALVGETPITYAEMHSRINSVMAFLEKLGIGKNDKVAILSTNMPHWGIAYFSVVFTGAVVVPLLPDFSNDEIKNTLKHSGAKAVFVSKGLISKLPERGIPALKYKIAIENFELAGSDGIRFEHGEKPKKKYIIEEDDLAAIIYTSGTTGKSKGVMLTHKNICFNAVKSRTIQTILNTDRFLSVLPLSHTYENTIGFVLPLINGASVYYLDKTPSPSVLIPALQKVKPTVMLTVPLIIEKIYKSKVLPAFKESKILNKLYGYTLTRKILNRKAGKKLMKTFGGELKFFGIGGAKLNEEVEKFLIEAKFPYAIGYGLTETAPLLAGFGPFKGKLQSAGKALEGVQLKIHNPDKESGEGEIRAKGDNVMKGYYKEPSLTKQVITPDGWFCTGDLGIIDEDGFLFIKGRLKNVIIGSGGENIYPEEIESVINNFKHVVESIVIEQKGKLVALVHFDRDDIKRKYNEIKEGIVDIETKCKEIVNELKDFVNSKVNRFSRISKVEPHKEEFVKTATKKIKRFLYKKEKEV
jgi:long-chain acyl-CoA synthetase